MGDRVALCWRSNSFSRKKKIERTIRWAILSVYFLTMASTAGREIMVIEAAGSIPTVVRIERKIKGQ